MATAVMGFIDLVQSLDDDPTRHAGRYLALRNGASKLIRQSLVGHEAALYELGDPLAELVCVACGAAADFESDVVDLLADWSLASDYMDAENRMHLLLLCPNCAPQDDEGEA